MGESRTIVNHPSMRPWRVFLPGILGFMLLAGLIYSLPLLVYSSLPVWAIMIIILACIVTCCFLFAATLYRSLVHTPLKVVLDDRGIEFHMRDGVVYAEWRDLGEVRSYVLDNSFFSLIPRLGYKFDVGKAGRAVRMDVSSEIAEIILLQIFGHGSENSCPNLKVTGFSKIVAGNPADQKIYWRTFILLTAIAVVPLLFLIIVLNGFLGLPLVLIFPVTMAIRLLGIRRNDVRGHKPIVFNENGIDVFLTARDRRSGLGTPIPYAEIERLRVLWEVWTFTPTGDFSYKRSFAILVLKDGRQLSLGARDSAAISWLEASVASAHSASSSI